MTPIIFRIVSVALLSLTLVPSSASAECAWVLWGSTDTAAHSSGFGIVTAYPTLQQCDAALRDEVVRLKRDGHCVTSPKDHVILAFKGSGADIMAQSFSCLPDTVDPRGPKGK